MAILALVILLGSLIQLKESSAEAKPEQSEPLRRHLQQILRDPGFVFYTLMGMLGMGAIISYVNQAPGIAISQGGLTPIGFALCFGAIGLLQLSGSLLAYRLSRWFGIFNCLRLGLALATVCGISLFFLPAAHPLWFFIPVAVGAFGLNLTFGHGVSLAMAPFRHCSGSAAAINGMARLSGGGLVAMLFGYLDLPANQIVALSFLVLLLLLPWIGAKASKAQMQAA